MERSDNRRRQRPNPRIVLPDLVRNDRKIRQPLTEEPTSWLDSPEDDEDSFDGLDDREEE